jgi:Family of unknown function (DUF5675)
LFTIEMVRLWETEKSTISTIAIPSASASAGELVSGYILERPGPDTTQSGRRLRIPDGTYNVQWAASSATPSLNSQAPLPWIYNSSVSASRRIYIHHGNFPSNTDGCLLTGTGRSKDMVTGSVTALTKLKAYLSRVGVENVQVRISSSYDA